MLETQISQDQSTYWPSFEEVHIEQVRTQGQPEIQPSSKQSAEMIESESDESAYNLTGALVSKDVEKIFTVLKNINYFLTGQEFASAEVSDIKDDISLLLNYGVDLKLYLADGGRSRFFVSTSRESSPFEFSIGEGNATNKVKERWALLKAKIK